jgi:hypothetical protein
VSEVAASQADGGSLILDNPSILSVVLQSGLDPGCRKRKATMANDRGIASQILL